MLRFKFVPCFFFYVIVVSSQTDFKDIVPPNPNVASLFKSTITPVNEYSGLPSVSIPLYNVTEGGISVPISLSYNTSGVRVSEESGIVGLGWALNIGGAITRTVNGNDDFAASSVGYLNHGVQYPDPIIGTGGYFDPDQYGIIDADANCKFLVNNVLTGFDMTELPYYQDYDFKPDMFYFNFNGFSGSFVLDPNGNAVIMEKEGLRISIDTSSGLSQAVRFSVTTGDGTIYEFDKTEFTNFSGSGLGIPGYTSTWYLTKIIDISGNYVDFIYENKGNLVPLRSFTQNYVIPASFTSTGSNDLPPTPTLECFEESVGPYTSIDGVYLSEVRFSNGKVKLNYSTENVRSDLNGYYLESIEIKDNTNNIIKRNDFNYSYFGNSGSGNILSLAQGDYSGSINSGSSEFPHFNLRLRLDSLTQDTIEAFSFAYFNSVSVPNKTTLDQDYWGYYNGVGNTLSFIPYINIHPGPVQSGSAISQFIAANRLPNGEKTKLFSLKKITYPTSGSTEFNYESNTFDKANVQTVVNPKSVAATANEDASGPPVTTTKLISPIFSANKPLKIEVNISLFGWDYNMSSTKPTLYGYQIMDMLRLRFKHSDGTLIKEYFFPSNEAQTQWNNSSSGYIGYQFPDEYWGTSLNPLIGSDFIIEAYFDDHNGLFRGQANITVSWEETQIDGQYYSVGGGLRINSITDFDSDGSIEKRKVFNYQYQEIVNGEIVERSYGKLKTPSPRYERSHKLIYFQRQTSSGQILEHNSVIIGSSASSNVFSKDAGSYVGYDQVETSYEGDNGDNGKQIKKFYNTEDLFRATNSIAYIDDYDQFPPERVPHNGLNYLTQNYKRNGSSYDLVSEIESEYAVNGFSASNFDLNKLYQNTDYVMGASKEAYFVTANNSDCNNFQFQLHPYYSNKIQHTVIREKQYDMNWQNPIINEQKFFYDNDLHLQKTRTESITSDGKVVYTKIYYPDDILNTSSMGNLDILTSDEYDAIDKLKGYKLHRISEPIQVEATINGQKTLKRTNYKTWPEINLTLPEHIQSSKGDNTLKNNIIYHSYDNKGNLTELSKEDGTRIIYIWGYNEQFPIAKIENAVLTDISLAIYNEILSKSNLDIDIASEGALRAALNNLRIALPNAMVTTYTYDPLIGVTSMTDPRGETIYYYYNNFNRLEYVKDAQGKILSKNEYHYKGQLPN